MTSTEPTTDPDLIRQWFTEHPDQPTSPRDLAEQVGMSTHRCAVILRRLLDTGELERDRSNTARSGPGVVYMPTLAYRPARTLDAWRAVREDALNAAAERRRRRKDATTSK